VPGLPRDLRGSRFCPHCGGALRSRRPEGDRHSRLVCGACGFILYLGLKVAAGTVAERDDRIVLIRRGVPPGEGLWSFPCGYAETDETLERCAIRETREETGLAVRLRGLLGAYSYPPSRTSGGRVAVLAYEALVTGGRPRAGDDALEVRLARPAEIPWRELAFSSSRDALRDWLARRGLPVPDAR
jgi:ADP-ribose pyrophosphatase YjhB (NUDIX family)